LRLQLSLEWRADLRQYMRIGIPGNSMRVVLAVALLAATAPAACTQVAKAQTACKVENAVYAERDNGYELRFHKGKPWEFSGMTDAVFDLVMPDGRKLWGTIGSNMGTSRDVGRVYYGCPSPTADDEPLSDEQHDACLQWEGVVYALNKGEPDFMPGEGENAPERILMTDLGRKIRYSDVVTSPGEEPWDVFDFKRCAK
jgi:hypothetical protein